MRGRKRCRGKDKEGGADESGESRGGGSEGNSLTPSRRRRSKLEEGGAQEIEARY